jgi:hypothetical protein
MQQRWLLALGFVLLALLFVWMRAFDHRREAPDAQAALRLPPARAQHAPPPEPLGLSISGQVLDPDGNPLPRINVSVRSGPEARSSMVPIRTDAAGHFEVHGLPAGSYRVVFWAEAPSGGQEHPWASAVLHDVEAGRDDLRVTLRAGRYARGVVQDASGQPLARIFVSARTRAGDQVAAITSAADGAFELLLAPDEEFELEARPPTPPAATRAEQAPPPDPSRYARLSGVHAGDQGLVLRFP